MTRKFRSGYCEHINYVWLVMSFSRYCYVDVIFHDVNVGEVMMRVWLICSPKKALSKLIFCSQTVSTWYIVKFACSM